MKRSSISIAIAMTMLLQTTTSSAVQTSPTQPNGPSTETVVPRGSITPPSADVQMNAENSDFVTSTFSERYRNFTVKPCESYFTAYHRFFTEMFPDQTPLLNECALGSLINMNKLQGFDPFGKILSAIKGAICGVIKDKIHDPFTNMINTPMEQANQWINSTNNQYSSWIDQQARDLQNSIYDPTSRYPKDGLTIPAFSGGGGNGNTGGGATTTPNPTPIITNPGQPGAGINNGGSDSALPVTPIQIDTGAGDDDTVEMDGWTQSGESQDDWSDLYNLFPSN